jgi:ribonuclease VapC
MIRFVIDASAVIAVLRSERGSDFIAPLCSSAIISAVNLQEVVKALTLRGVAIDVVKAMIDNLQLEICSHGEDEAYAAAVLVKQTSQYRSGLADRTCIALAIARNLPVLTTNRAWAQLAIDGLEVILAR